MSSKSHADLQKSIESESSVTIIEEGVAVKHIPKTPDEVVPITYDNILFIPNFLEFNEASEGLTSRQRVVIKNAGTKPAFIKIYPPSSMAFHVEVTRKIAMLNPGLSISALVTYNFKRPSFLRAIIPIEINGRMVDYHVACKLLIEGISVEPNSIDFGFVDIGYSSGIKVIILKNEGGKSTRFSIDLGTNDLEITVKPMRGIVKPNRPIQLTVELIGMHEGVFFSEFWIKSVPNIRIPFKVNVIVPRLVIYHPNATGDFTLLDFSATVANTRKNDSFVLRNISSQVASYVVLGEIDNEFKCIRDINKEKYPVYSAFDIRPIQGRIGPFEGIIFEVGFRPTINLMKPRNESWVKLDKGENDFMAFLRIVRVHVTETQDLSRFDLDTNYQLSEWLTSYHKKDGMPIMDFSSSSSESSVESIVPDVVRLCLHGEVAEGRLKFEPNVLYFGELKVGEDSQRMVRISNPLNFAHLHCCYVQCTSIHCHPRSMILKPEGTIEVTLKLTGRESVKSTFKVYFDVEAESYESLTNRHKSKIKVGSYSVQCTAAIKYVVTVKQSCKPIIRSIFGTDYEDVQPVVGKKMQKLSAEQLLPIMQKEGNMGEKQIDRKIEQKILQLPQFEDKRVPEIISCSDINYRRRYHEPYVKASTEVLIPLTPLQIYNVRMYPTLFSFGMVVPRSRNYRQLIIENLNEFPVMIRLTNSLSRCVDFPQGNLIILPPGTVVTRLVEFRAYHFGKFNGYVDYIINDNHSFELAVTANIVEKQLSLDTREIVFGKDWLKEENYQPMDCSVQIRNKLGAKTSFKWEVSETCSFFVEPASGSVRGNSSLYSYISYKPDVTKANCTEMIMKCENSSYIAVRLSLPIQSPKVSFINDTIDFGEIPLNLPLKRTAFLRNYEHYEVEFVVDSSLLVRGCTIEPLHGVMPPRGITTMEILLTFSLCFKFVMCIRVTVQKTMSLPLKITGTVAFPQLRLQPRSIIVRRMCDSAYQRHLLTATNAGTTMLKLNFLLDEYPEFHVSRSTQKQDPFIGHEGIVLGPGTSQEFHLHFEAVDLASYEFYFPIVINDILGPPSITNHNALKPSQYLKQFKEIYEQLPNFTIHEMPPTFAAMSIDCTIVRHVVSFDNLVFHFNFVTQKVSDQFVIRNRDSVQEKSILIDISSFSNTDCPFSISWARGVKATMNSDCIQCTLNHGEQCSFTLEFQPKTRGNFSLEAPIFVRDEMDNEMFNKLCITGEYHAPTIHSEHAEIYFEPVALNTLAEKTFRLNTKYFGKETSIQLKMMTPDRFSGAYDESLLSVTFVPTNIAPPTDHSELEVKAVFMSKTPVSFRTIVEFFDSNGLAVCPVRIHATADNSLITLHSSLRSESSTLPWRRDGDKRTDTSRMSNSFSIDEDDGIFPSKSRKLTTSKGMSLAFSEGKSRHSFDKLMDYRGKRSLSDKEIDDGSSSGTEGEPTRIPESEIFESVCSTELSTTSFEKSIESVKYPFFPFGDENDEYEKYMEDTMKAAKEWLYTGPFKFTYYPEIPNGISITLEELFSKRQSQVKRTARKTAESGRTFIDVLVWILGPTIYEQIALPKSLPEKDVEKASCAYGIYENILSILTKNGAHLSHVSAQFLLKYHEYTVFTRSARTKNLLRKSHGLFPTQKKLPFVKFVARSKQCWLDIILQTYKCFVLTRITEIQFTVECTPIPSGRRSTIHRASIVSSLSSVRKFYENHKLDTENIHNNTLPNNTYSINEMFLLGWLNYHYEEQRAMDWMADRRLVLNPNATKDSAEERYIRNFDNDLTDSLVLIAVTAAYCSFIIEECFYDIYVCPRSYEEVLHNAVCVVKAWRKIRLGFVISPMEIMYPNCIKMLMLVTHLFDVLQTYIPKSKVRFSCALTETVVRQINLTNSTGYNVGYLTLFFGNNSEFFRAVIPHPVFRLSAHKSAAINIEYYARKIKKTRAYVLFCGSTIGPHFGKNQMFMLEGQADNLAISSNYTICSGLYQAIDKTLLVMVPYKNSAEYEIWMSEQQPNQARTLKQTRWSELRLRKIPRRLFLNQDTIVVDKDTDKAGLSVTVACITPIDRSFWIIFQSTLGDFIIQITSQWQASLTDNIVVQWNEETGKCMCTEDSYSEICPLNLSVPIPSRNKQLWTCVAHMFQKTLDPKERLFWSRYLDTHIGLRLIRWLMGDSADAAAKEFSHIFNSTVKYNVTIPEDPNILNIPKTFTINDVRPSVESTTIQIHISPESGKLGQNLLTLTSLDGKERRTYMVNFLHS